MYNHRGKKFVSAFQIIVIKNHVHEVFKEDLAPSSYFYQLPAFPRESPQ